MMRKVLALLLMICMIFGMGAGFAMKAPEPTVLDPRVKPFYVKDFLPGDVKFLSDGNLVLQKATQDSSGELWMDIEKVDGEGRSLKSVAFPFSLAEAYWTDILFGFVVEDANGNIFTNTDEIVWRIPSDFSEAMPAMEMPEMSFSSWCDVKSKDHVMINFMRDYQSEYFGHTMLAALTYPEGLEPIDSGEFYLVDLRRDYEVLELMDIDRNNGLMMAADFGDASDEVYILVAEDSEAGWIWKIGRFTIMVSEDPMNEGMFSEMRLEETIQLETEGLFGLEDDFIIASMEYDGEGFKLATLDRFGDYSKIVRFSTSGELTDSIELPGLVLHFDTKGNKTVASVVNLDEIDYYLEGSESAIEYSGYYMIEWEESGGSTGSPKSLIQERSRNGKTLAEFQDGSYGLLRREDPDTGAVDYLVPLKTEERDVRLRIPLCDVLAKLGDGEQNLEILFGEDRIRIPMSALAVQDLLAQMPCETDATIEFHLVRNEDGSVTVTAELFVVEQVDAVTKVVHRLPIPLP